MYNLLQNMINLFGLNTEVLTFPQLIVWIVSVVLAMEFVLFTIDGVFYAVRSIAKGVR